MAKEHVSFVADSTLVNRIRKITLADGTTPSQAAACAVALSAMLPSAARRTFQSILLDGDGEVRRTLAALLAHAVAQAGNRMVEQLLLEIAWTKSMQAGPEDDDTLVQEAISAVEEHRRGQRAVASSSPGSPGIGC